LVRAQEDLPAAGRGARNKAAERLLFVIRRIVEKSLSREKPREVQEDLPAAFRQRSKKKRVTFRCDSFFV
jgi:hypothetical protein